MALSLINASYKNNSKILIYDTLKLKDPLHRWISQLIDTNFIHKRNFQSFASIYLKIDCLLQGINIKERLRNHSNQFFFTFLNAPNYRSSKTLQGNLIETWRVKKNSHHLLLPSSPSPPKKLKFYIFERSPQFCAFMTPSLLPPPPCNW